jgi:hypothetical protein
MVYIAVATLPLSFFSDRASASILHNEDVDGDLSNMGSAPTNVGDLMLGSNSLKATFNAGMSAPDPDYFTFTIPKGLALKEILLNSWGASDGMEDIAFFAVETGATFDFDLSSAPPDSRATGLLGWSHIRSAQVVGTHDEDNKILIEMSLADEDPENTIVGDFYQEEKNNLSPTGDNSFLIDRWESGAEGFKLPLGPGEYSFWLRQGSDVKITVELNFNTQSVPESSSSVGLLAIAALGMAGLFHSKERQMGS